MTKNQTDIDNPRGLVRAFGVGYVVIFVIANILGSGVYKKIAPMAAELHSSTWILLAWAVAGLITLFGALSNAEVAGLLADTGGDFIYFRKIYNRFFAFLYGWSFFTVIQTATIASVAYIFAQSVNSIFPLPQLLPGWQDVSLAGIFYPFKDLNIKLTAAVLILVLTWVNIRSLRTGAGTSKAITLTVVAGLGVIIIFGLLSALTGHVSTGPVQDQVKGTVTYSSFYTALLAAFWAYQGWSSVGFIGGEIKDSKRNLPRGIMIGTLLVIGIYLLVNFTYLKVLSVPRLVEIHEAGNSIAAVEVVRAFWGQAGALFISLLIIVTTLGCTNASILTGARPVYAMAKEGLFFRSLTRINRANVPSMALLWVGIWSAILVFSGTFDQLTDMIIFAVYIFYGATALGVFVLRRRMPDAPRPYKVWGYPVVPALFILFCIGLFVNTIITRPREAGIGIVLILIGMPVYWVLNGRQRKA
jgi:APA family basic amino acid/polyamine antiporter